MARIESAYEAAKNLPEKAAKRVLQWAKDEFHPESPDENGQGSDG